MTDMTLKYAIHNKNPEPLTVMWSLGPKRLLFRRSLHCC